MVTNRSKVLAAALAGSLVLSSTSSHAGPAPSLGRQFGAGTSGWLWAIFGCSSGIIVAAMVANSQQNRQLTQAEALSCGLLFWFNPPRRR